MEDECDIDGHALTRQPFRWNLSQPPRILITNTFQTSLTPLNVRPFSVRGLQVTFLSCSQLTAGHRSHFRPNTRRWAVSAVRRFAIFPPFDSWAGRDRPEAF
ncbi:hypothetical protein FRC03_004881 [Tulasnella sp. 419]|nr:hypothetical protein FRC03_004881 [Tulasnella sp. 419]